MISKLRKLVGRECIEWRMGRARCFKRTETVRAQTNILISFEPSLIDYVIQRFRERARGREEGIEGREKSERGRRERKPRRNDVQLNLSSRRLQLRLY